MSLVLSFNDVINKLYLLCVTRKKSNKHKWKKSLGDLIEGITNSDVAKKVEEVVENIDLDKAKEVVKDVAEKGGDVFDKVKDIVEDVLEKTDIDDKIMEKGGDLLNDVLGHFKK